MRTNTKICSFAQLNNWMTAPLKCDTRIYNETDEESQYTTPYYDIWCLPIHWICTRTHTHTTWHSNGSDPDQIIIHKLKIQLSKRSMLKWCNYNYNKISIIIFPHNKLYGMKRLNGIGSTRRLQMKWTEKKLMMQTHPSPVHTRTHAHTHINWKKIWIFL